MNTTTTTKANTESTKSPDVYTTITEEVNAILREHLVNGSDDTVEVRRDSNTGRLVHSVKLGTHTLAKQWLEFGFSRSVAKRSVVTLAYCSRIYGFRDQMPDFVVNSEVEAGKADVFTIPSQACCYISELIRDVLGSVMLMRTQKAVIKDLSCTSSITQL